jgi:hypothetical protein
MHLLSHTELIVHSYFLLEQFSTRQQVPSYPHLKTETDPVSETLWFLVFRIPDDEQSPETR